MGYVELSQDGKSLVVSLLEQADLQVLKVAFKATLGSDDISQAEIAGTYTTPLDNPGNVCALWATGFEWHKNAMKSLIDILLPLAQRRSLFRSNSAFDQRGVKPEEQSR